MLRMVSMMMMMVKICEDDEDVVRIVMKWSGCGEGDEEVFKIFSAY